MASQTALMAVLLLTTLCGTSFAQAGTGPRRLVAVNAGTTFSDIGELTGSPPLRICPENHPNGISIRCEGNPVRAPVRMYIDDNRVQTEGRSPYHIAGDIDGGGLQEIFAWDDYLRVTPRPNGIRRFRIKCMYKNPNGIVKEFSKPLIIEGEDCGSIF